MAKNIVPVPPVAGSVKPASSARVFSTWNEIMFPSIENALSFIGFNLMVPSA